MLGEDGQGPPATERARLFSPFFRAEAGRSRATAGMGLGLVVVRRVAELHGGAAGAAAAPTGGLRVWIRVPTSTSATQQPQAV